MNKKFGLAIILSLLIYTIIILTKDDSLINTLNYYNFNNFALSLEMLQIFVKDYINFFHFFGNDSITNISFFSSANDLKVNILLTYVPIFLILSFIFNKTLEQFKD